MPKILETAVKKIMSKGQSKSAAFAIATSSLKKAGDLNSKGKATGKGVRRGNMTEAQRKKTRKP